MLQDFLSVAVYIPRTSLVRIPVSEKCRELEVDSVASFFYLGLSQSFANLLTAFAKLCHWIEPYVTHVL